MSKMSLAPIALKSKTIKGLERLMLFNNVGRQAYHDYQICWDGSSWVAWYYADQSRVASSVEQEILNSRPSQGKKSGVS